MMTVRVPFEQAVLDVTGGNQRLLTTEYKPVGAIPVIDQGQAEIAGFTDDLSAACRRDGPVILFGDHTRTLKFVDFDFALGADGVKVLKPLPGFDARFLFHFLRTVRLPENLGYSRHFKYLKECSVPKPAPEVQRRIATILDKADTIRSKRQEAIRLSDEFMRAVFLNMFGAPGDVSHSFTTQPLGDVCRFYAGNSLPNGEPFAGQLDGVLHIKVGDMNLPGNESVVSTSREWSANGAGGIVAPEGAILIPKRGGAIATNKKRVLGRPCALDPNLMAISPGLGLREELLFQWFKLFDLSTITSGSAIPQLNKGDLAPLRIVVPPMAQQDRFAAIAQRVNAITNKQASQLVDIESACDSLTAELLEA